MAEAERGHRLKGRALRANARRDPNVKQPCAIVAVEAKVDAAECVELQDVEGSECVSLHLLYDLSCRGERLVGYATFAEVVVDSHHRVTVIRRLRHRRADWRRDHRVGDRQDGDAYIGARDELLHRDRLADPLRNLFYPLVRGLVIVKDGVLGDAYRP